MKKSYKIFTLFFALATLIFSCNEEEMAYIDPMIDGMCTNSENVVKDLIESEVWNEALVGFRTQRIKLLGIRTLIENDGYTGEEYALEDPAQAKQRVAEAIALVEMKLDSVWDAEIADKFADIDQDSPGVSNFGTVEYASASNDIDAIYAWLYEDTEDATEVEYISNDISGLTEDFALLKGLSDMLESEVTEYITSTRARFATMQQQYANLASQVESSGYFSKAQKDLYASLKDPIDEMEPVVNGQITLGTNNELDVIDRDLSALVYFVDNNYTSPAQAPLVYGEISSITELRWLSEQATENDLSKDWVITTDIDAAETHRWNGNAGYYSIPKLTGSIDGQFHIISGLKLAIGENYTAFVANLNAPGEIKNIGFVNASGSTPNQNHGAIVAGYVRGGKLSKCFAHGAFGVKGQSGGLIGRPDGATIENCFINVRLWYTGANQIGGLFGVGIANVTCNNVYSVGLLDNIGASHKGALIGNWGDAIEKLVLSGLYYDYSTTKVLGCVQVSAVEEQLTDLSTDKWNDLANFPEFSSDDWEIKTVTEIDVNARPYLKGFNYDGIKDMIVPE